MTIRVLVADDQQVVRTGLRTIIDVEDDIEVVAEAADGREAVEMARQVRPDVCLLDIRMPGLDGIEATRMLAGPDVEDPMAVVVITTFDLDEYVHAALTAGACGFLLKDSDPALLAQAVRAAASGEALIAPRVTRRLLEEFTESASAPGEAVDVLTDRETEVTRAVAAGLTNAEIAEQLNISVPTVKTHLGQVMTKLTLRNRVELAMWAYRNGLAD